MTPEESVECAQDLAELEYWRMVNRPDMDYKSRLDGLSHRERIAFVRDQAKISVLYRMECNASLNDKAPP